MLILNYILDFPLDNPVLIFSLILFIILFAPIILNKVRIPPIIGLIIAGALIGPYGFNLMLRDSSIILFGTVGLLYIMFISGLDTEIREFKKNLLKSIVFSLLTFSIPMFLGIISSYYLLGFPVLTSILLASMYASNTLITYPMLGKLGITKNKVVNIAVSGTLVTTILALLVLAVIVGMANGTVNQAFWIKISISIILFIATVMIFFPIITRWFFKRYNDNISQYIFVLGMVYLGAFLAEIAGIDKIVGAFLAGLAMNSLIPKTSPLMNRINFVGNALFIPFFLIGVGMLINYRAFFYSTETILVAITMTITATFSKYSAAWLTQKIFGFSKPERTLLFGLTNAQAASTLAAVLVGYSIVTGETPAGEPVRLLNESVLNGTIFMILITCTIASFATQNGGQEIAIKETGLTKENTEYEERILVPVSNPDTVDELIDLGISLKSKRKGLYALSIVTSKQSDLLAEKNARDNLQKASVFAAATDNEVYELLRYDHNIVSGITNVVKEHKITDLIMGLHHKKGITDSFLGKISEGIISKCNITTYIYKPVQPMSTLKRQLLVIPAHAEKVIGFSYWINKVINIAINSGTELICYAPLAVIEVIKKQKDIDKIECSFIEFFNWNYFVNISKKIKSDDNLIVILSRKSHISYNPTMGRIPLILNRFFSDNSFLLIYPIQRGVENSESFLSNKTETSTPHKIEKFDDLGQTIDNLLSKKM